MTENMKKFSETVSKNEELTAKVGSLGKDELLALAKELGIELTEADLEKPAAEELSDDDLDTVAGYSKNGRERCVCGFAGYGT